MPELKYAYKIAAGKSDEEFEAELNRQGQKGYRALKLYDCPDGQKSLMEKQIFETDDRRRT